MTRTAEFSRPARKRELLMLEKRASAGVLRELPKGKHKCDVAHSGSRPK
jgi:hypothetical protein